MADDNFKKYFFWVVVIILAMLSYYIIQDFLIALLSAFILAYLLLPIHRLFSKIINKKLSAILVLLLLSILIIVPLFFVSQTLVNQVSAVVSSEDTAEIAGSIGNYLSRFNTNNQVLSAIQEKIPVLIERVGELLLNLLSYLLSYIPNLLFLVIIIFFVSYFLLIDWDKLVKTIESILPFKDKKKIMGRVSSNAQNIIYGSLFIAIIAFIVAAVGFWLAGSNWYVFLAFLVAIAVFIPLIGPALVWVPMLVLALVQVDYTAAIIIAVTGILLSAVINGLLVTIIISKKSRIHPIVILLGIFGGVKLFGLFGFVIGPLILSFFIDFVIHASKEKTV
ncbi:MAG: AI-2E family transporter [Candidatus Pacearchaeota archaeon]|nr:AI-2E family transporter [Candidatus Pacearchaeota archaeon]